jgi:hypothetical protein
VERAHIDAGGFQRLEEFLVRGGVAAEPVDDQCNLDSARGGGKHGVVDALSGVILQIHVVKQFQIRLRTVDERDQGIQSFGAFGQKHETIAVDVERLGHIHRHCAGDVAFASRGC